MSTTEPGVEQASANHEPDKHEEVKETKKKATRSKTATNKRATEKPTVEAAVAAEPKAAKSATTKSAAGKTNAGKTQSAAAESASSAPVVEVTAPAESTPEAPATAQAPAKKRTPRKKNEATTSAVEVTVAAIAPAPVEAPKGEMPKVETLENDAPAAPKKQGRPRKQEKKAAVESAPQLETPAASAPAESAPVESAPTPEPETARPVEASQPAPAQVSPAQQDQPSNGDGQKSRRRGRRGRGSEARKKAAQQANGERNGERNNSERNVQTQSPVPVAQRSDAPKHQITKTPATDAPTHQTTKTPAAQAPAAELPKTRWYKADLHMHTPASNDYEDPELSWLDWLRTVAERGLEIVAVTDHNTVAGVAAIRREIEWLTRLEQQNRLTDAERADLNAWRDLSNRVLVLPGFEFTATFGFHILGIFPPETSVRTLEQLLLTLKVPVEKLDVGSTETGASADVLTAYKVIHDAGGLAIAAHANSTHGVALRDFPFGGQTKIAYTQDPNLDALEVTDLEGRGYSTARFFDGRKQEYPRKMHCIQGSDSHRVNTDPRNPKRLGIGERATEMFLDESSFQAIVRLLRSTAFGNTRPAQPKDKPFDPFASAREEGASIVQSFHEAPNARGKIDAILADICAFANTSGGNIYVGANPRMERVSGLARPRQVEEQIEQALELTLTPPLDIRFETIKSNNASILRIQVPKGEDRPYCLDGNRFYVRDEGETNLAVRDEIIAMVLETMNQRTVEIAPGVESLALSGAPATAVLAEAAPVKSEKKSATRRGKQSERKSKGGAAESPAPIATNGSTPFAASNTDPNDAFYLPQMGVEIVESNTRNGNHFHTIRDLRKGTVVQNVTRSGARDLWSYAIRQQETGAIKPAAIQWQGNIGLAHVERRAGKMRYDLALREGKNVRIFYGVTQDGMEGPWAAFLQEE